MKATQLLHNLGQSIWLDNITRDLLTSGTLKRYIDELSVTGLTSNPTIFDHAIKNSTAYDAAIRKKLDAGKSGEELFFELALEDLTRAADLFRPIYDRTNSVDGWVSLEVSPLLAHDTASTLAAAKSLHARAGRPNLLIKIPGTKEGLPAIEEAIRWRPVNVTPCFREQYVARPRLARYERGPKPLMPEVFRRFGFRRRWTRPSPAKTRRAEQHLVAIAQRTYRRPATARLTPLAAQLQRWRPSATPAVGQHGHQGSPGFRCPLYQGAGCAFHSEHDARRNLESPRRSRRS
jgi:transaldolase